MSDQKPIDYQSVESRRSSKSNRRMTRKRRLYYFLGTPVLRFITKVLLSSYRYEPVIGSENIEPFLDGKASCAPAYWHGHHVLCSALVRRWIRRGFRACFLISGSVDGDVPERIARAWGAEVIRGSANESGALALRDQHAMMKRGFSIVTTADGPRGPQHEIKAGVMVMARVGGIPVLPVACAAENAWYLDRWDDFMIPKPFAKVVLAVGEPIVVPRDSSMDRMEDYRLQMQYATNALMKESEQLLGQKGGA